MKTEFNKVCAILMFLLFLKIENNNLYKRNYSKINYTFEENDSFREVGLIRNDFRFDKYSKKILINSN